MMKTIPTGPTTGFRNRVNMKIDVSADINDCFLNKKWMPYVNKMVKVLRMNNPRTVMNPFRFLPT